MATAALVFAGLSLLVDLVNALQMTDTFGPCRGQYQQPRRRYGSWIPGFDL